MNERIQALAEQSGLEYNFDPMLWSKYEKFAELLIREAAMAITTRDCRAEPIEHIFILKHFGIEP